MVEVGSMLSAREAEHKYYLLHLPTTRVLTV